MNRNFERKMPPPSARSTMRRTNSQSIFLTSSCRGGSVNPVELDRRQVCDLVLAEAEPHAVVDAGDGTDRDSDFLLAPEMALVEQDVGDVVVGRVDNEALDAADSAISGVDVVAAAHLDLTHGHTVTRGRQRAVTH